MIRLQLSLTILFAIAVAGNVPLGAQPILDQRTLPAPSTSIPLLICDTLGIAPGPAGVGVTWNFSNLRRRITSPDSMNLRYAAMGEIPQAIRDSFPLGQVAIVDDTTTTVGAVIAGRFRVLGVSSPSAHVASLPVDPYDSRPTELTYNGPFSDTWRAQVTVSPTPVTLQRSGFHRIVYDGFGVLVLPAITFTDVARVKDSLVIADTLKEGPNTIVITKRVVIVTWLKPDSNSPLLEIQTISTTSTRNGVPFGQRITSKSVRSYPWFTPNTVVNEEKVHTFSITPNPVTGNVVRVGPWDAPPRTVWLYGLQGAALIAQSVTQTASGYWDIELPVTSSGVYTMVVEFGQGKTTNDVRVAQLVVIR